MKSTFKKSKPISMMLAITLLLSFTNMVIPAAASTPVNNSLTVTIWAGQNNNAGSVTVSNDNDNLYLHWNLNEDWDLAEVSNNIKVYVGLDNPGDASPGSFPYKYTETGKSGNYTYPLDTDWYEEDIWIAIHFDLLSADDGSEETGWAGNPDMWPRVHFPYYIEIVTPEPVPDYTITKVVDYDDDGVYTDSESNTEGNTAHWKIIVENTGETILNNLIVVDDNGESYTISSLGVGGKDVHEYDTIPTESLINIAVLSSDILPDESDQAEVEVIPVDEPIKSYSIEKTVDYDGDDVYSEVETNTEGTTAHWKIVVTNTGDVLLENLSVVDTNGESYSIDSLDVGETDTYIYDTIPTISLVNTATLSGEDLQDLSDTAEVIITPIEEPKEYSLTIEKTVDYDQDDVFTDSEENILGTTAHWKIVVTNTGNQLINDIEVSDSNGEIFPLFDLKPQESKELEYDTIPTVDTLNTATVESPFTDPLTDDAAVIVLPVPIRELLIEKTVDFNGDGIYTDSETNILGSVANWKIVVTNTGNTPIYNISVVDGELVEVVQTLI